ncbi:MAG: cell division protein SepF [Christensenellaceae bacterium]|jgi:FtsZ-interacting cell division protein YlmF|nr:cell division protein SepF [Christensenellaceae bacterium]
MGLLNIFSRGIVIEKGKHNVSNLPKAEENQIPEPAPAVKPAEQSQPAAPAAFQPEIARPTLYDSQPMMSANVIDNSYNNFSVLSGNKNIWTTAPKNQQDISMILDHIAKGNCCIISLELIDSPQRHLDFISGFMFALGGSMQMINETQYILTAKDMTIRN